MIVSDKYKFIFIHNPKTGGMSIRSTLEGITMDPRFNGPGKIKGRTVELMHLTMKDIYENYPDIVEKFKTYYTFMIVRNPYTRFISAFNYSQTDIYDKFIETEDFEEYKKSFNSFVDLIHKETLKGTDRYLFVRQVDMGFYNGKTPVDNFYRLEGLPETFARFKMQNKFLFNRIMKMKHTNKRAIPVDDFRIHKDLFSEESKEKIRELYSKDFEQFNYSLLF